MDEKFFSDWKAAKARDEALLEAARLRHGTLLSRYRVVREKAQALLSSLGLSTGDQGLLADLDALEEAIKQML